MSENKSAYKRIKHFVSGISYACDTNDENLIRILRDNEGTEFGRRFGFDGISSADEFSEAVPLAGYSDFEGYIQRIYSGEENILTAYPVRNFLLSSGTKGKPKLFPLTEEALERYSSYIVDTPADLIDADEQKMIHTSVFRPAGSRGETLLSSAYYGYLDSKGSLPMYLGGRELTFSDRIKDVPYVKLRIMLAYEDLSAVHSIFLYDVLLLFSYLEENWGMLLDDIRHGRISADLPCDIEAKINSLPKIEANRIRQLEEIFDGGFDTPVVPAIWQNLRYISGIGGGSFAVQTRMLRKYTGDIPVYYFAYASSEIMAGAAFELDRAEYALLPGSAYYEFLPEDSGETVSVRQVKTGEIYEPVVTTFSGLYRYKTGDLIKITGNSGQVLTFEVIGRKGDILNIAGEKLTALSMLDAAVMVAEEIHDMGDFCAAADYSVVPARFHIFAESGVPAAQLSEAFDDKLKQTSIDYEDIRGLGMLGSPLATCLERGFLSEALSSQTGHNKPKLFLTQKQYEKLKSEVAKLERK